VAEELLRPSFNPKAEKIGSHLYLILHLPLFDSSSERHQSRELDIVVGKKSLITVHYQQLAPVSEFFNSLELNINLREKVFLESSAPLLYFIWAGLYENLTKELEYLHKKIDRLEERIFSSSERELISDISYLRRDILDFFRALRPHHTVLESIRNIDREIFGKEFSEYLYELSSAYHRLLILLGNNKDTIETLYETHNSLLSHKTGETLKTFTMLALLTFPLTLIATLFSIDAISRPIVGQPGDFWLIISIMALVVISMLLFFKYRRWI
jgi:magnesium transporter